MAIFYPDTHYPHNSDWDTPLTVIFALILIISTLISFLLNPVVFIYNYKQPPSIGSRLFQLLAAVDFLFLLRAVTSLYNLVKPIRDPMFIIDTTLTRRGVCLFTYVLGFSSMAITCAISFVRYIKIRFPLWGMSHEWIVSVITWSFVGVNLVWLSCAAVLINFGGHDAYEWSSALQTVIVNTTDELGATYTLSVLILLVNTGISLVLSLLTVVHLFKSGNQLTDMKRRSAIMILYLNVGLLIWCVLSIGSEILSGFKPSPEQGHLWPHWYFYLQFTEGVICQAVLVAYNPLIICLRNTGIRTMVRDLVHFGVVHYPHSTTTTGDSSAEEMKRKGNVIEKYRYKYRYKGLTLNKPRANLAPKSAHDLNFHTTADCVYVLLPPSIGSRLFQLLAAVDFLFLLRAVSSLYNLIKPIRDPMFIVDASLTRRGVCLFTYVLGFSSMAITCAISFVRYVKIRFPLWGMSHKKSVSIITWTFVGVNLVWLSCAAVLINFGGHEKYEWSSALQTVIVNTTDAGATYTLSVLMFLVNTGISLVLSLLTVVHLFKSGNQLTDMKWRSAIMILYLNVGLLIWCVLSIGSEILSGFKPSPEPDHLWPHWFFYLQFTEGVICQAVLVAYNPLIICLRNTGIRTMIRDLVRFGVVHYPHSTTTTGDSSAGSGQNWV
eukprot:sb/3462792/